jgi:hypothetical protein
MNPVIEQWMALSGFSAHWTFTMGTEWPPAELPEHIVYSSS